MPASEDNAWSSNFSEIHGCVKPNIRMLIVSY